MQTGVPRNEGPDAERVSRGILYLFLLVWILMIPKWNIIKKYMKEIYNFSFNFSGVFLFQQKQEIWIIFLCRLVIKEWFFTLFIGVMIIRTRHAMEVKFCLLVASNKMGPSLTMRGLVGEMVFILIPLLYIYMCVCILSLSLSLSLSWLSEDYFSSVDWCWRRCAWYFVARQEGRV